MSHSKIHVGNLPANATAESIRAAFEAFGTVHKVTLLVDPDTGLSRNSAFVEMDPDAAGAAVDGLNDRDLDGSTVTVNELQIRGPGGKNSRYARNW